MVLNSEIAGPSNLMRRIKTCSFRCPPVKTYGREKHQKYNIVQSVVRVSFVDSMPMMKKLPNLEKMGHRIENTSGS
jgi:hypothetical protein